MIPTESLWVNSSDREHGPSYPGCCAVVIGCCINCFRQYSAHTVTFCLWPTCGVRLVMYRPLRSVLFLPIKYLIFNTSADHVILYSCILFNQDYTGFLSQVRSSASWSTQFKNRLLRDLILIPPYIFPSWEYPKVPFALRYSSLLYVPWPRWSTDIFIQTMTMITRDGE